MNIKIFSIISLILFSSFTVADEQITNKQVNELNAYIYDSLSSRKNEKFIKTNRITKEGLLDRCELEFETFYRDIRGQENGIINTVIVMGSFSAMYIKDSSLPSITALLKINPSVININTKSWDTIRPPYIEIVIDNVGLNSKYTVVEFKCDSGGKCLEYFDKKKGVEILGSILQIQPFDAEVRFALKKGSSDTSFKLSTLSANDISLKERQDFTNCTIELWQIMKSDYENLVK